MNGMLVDGRPFDVDSGCHSKYGTDRSNGRTHLEVAARLHVEPSDGEHRARHRVVPLEDAFDLQSVHGHVGTQQPRLPSRHDANHILSTLLRRVLPRCLGQQARMV